MTAQADQLEQSQMVGVDKVRVGPTLYLVERFRMNPKQAQAWAMCDEPYPVKEILLDGAIRCGKTQIGMKKIVKWAMKYPRTTWIIFRKTRQELNDSTKKILLDGVEMPPVLPPELVAQRWDSADINKVKLVNGSEILFRSLEPNERGKIRNMTIAGFLIDQAEELDDDDVDEPYYIELLGRVSDPRTPRKAILIANPAPETHWLCRRFGCTDEADEIRSDQLRSQTRRVHLTVLDNAMNLHPEYVKDLLATEHTQPDYYRQMVLGLWGSFGGRRFKTFTKADHVCDPFNIPSEWEIVEGIDWGNTNPCAVVWIAIDHYGRWYVIHEHYQAEMSVAWHSLCIKQTRLNHVNDKYPPPPGWVKQPFDGPLDPSATYMDPSAWNRQRKEISSVADSFVENGIYSYRAQNERIGGWQRIEEMLAERMADGKPKLMFFSHCKNTIRELSNLKWKVGTEDVEKQHDHTSDALRYVVMSRTPTPIDRAVKPPDVSRQAVIKRKIERRKKKDDQNPRTITRI